MFGVNAHLGLAKEAVFGTPLAATDYVMFVSESLSHEIEQLMETSLRGSPDEPPQFAGLETFRGDVVFEGRPQLLGYFLQSCLGNPATSGTGPYTHVFTPRTDAFSDLCALQPYTLEIHRDLGAGNAFQFAGSIVNTLALEFGVGQKILKCTAGIIAKDLANIAKTTPSYADENPFLWHQAAISVGGSGNQNLESLGLTINNNCEGIPLLNGTKKIAKIKRTGYRTLDFSATFDVDDLAEYNRFKNQTETAFVITLTSGTDELKLELNKVRYTAFPLNVSGPGRLTVAVTGKAKYDATKKLVTVTLKNGKATY